MRENLNNITFKVSKPSLGAVKTQTDMPIKR